MSSWAGPSTRAASTACAPNTSRSSCSPSESLTWRERLGRRRTHAANAASNNWPWQAIVPVQKALSCSLFSVPWGGHSKQKITEERGETGVLKGEETTTERRTNCDSEGQAEKTGWSFQRPSSCNSTSLWKGIFSRWKELLNFLQSYF